mgnify:CR=1 FL=1
MFGRITDYNINNQIVEIKFEKKCGQVEIISESIINIFAALESQEHRSKAIENLQKKQVSYHVEREEECIVITTSKITAKVYDEFKVDFYDKDGKVLCRDYRGRRKKVIELTEEDAELMAAEGHEIEEQVNLPLHIDEHRPEIAMQVAGHIKGLGIEQDMIVSHVDKVRHEPGIYYQRQH